MPEPSDNPPDSSSEEGNSPPAPPDPRSLTPDPQPLAHDLLDPAAQFDPTQWAMHGLLSVYFDGDEADRTRKADAILARIAAERAASRGTGVPPVRSSARGSTGETPVPQFPLDPLPPPPRHGTPHSIYHRLRPFRWPATALAAAIMVAVIGILAGSWPEAPASADVITDAALHLVPPYRLSAALLSDDPAEMQAFESAINEARRLLETALSEAKQASDEDARATAADDAMKVWPSIFRRLRAIGRWPEALREVEAAIKYTRVNPTGQHYQVWENVFLCDLGDTTAALGDYERAIEAYEHSIQAREAGHPKPVPNIVLEAYTSALVPLYWRLGDLELMREGTSGARRWHEKAGMLLRNYFHAVCGAGGVQLPTGASILDAYAAAPEIFRKPKTWPTVPERRAANLTYDFYTPSATVVVQLRGHLHREARLRRIEGDFEGATNALSQAANIPYYAPHDESRLDFNEPLEAARIAIARGDFQSALSHARDAAANTGEIPLCDPDEKDISKPPIDPLSRAERDLVHGAALLGLDPDSGQGKRLVQDAWAIPEKMADRLNELDAERFLKRFEAWRRLAGDSRRSIKP